MVKLVMSTKNKKIILVFLNLILLILFYFIFLQGSGIKNNEVLVENLENESKKNDLVTNVENFYINTSLDQIDLFIVNMSNEQLSLDSVNNTYINEIPNSYIYREGYESEGSTDFYTGVIAVIEKPIMGVYQIKVSGIEDTDYTIYVSTDSKNQNSKSQISSTIKKGETQEFMAELMGDGQVSIERK